MWVMSSVDSSKKTKQGPNLFPFVGNERRGLTQVVTFSFRDYLELVDWTGRAIRENTRRHIPPHLAPISITGVSLHHSSHPPRHQRGLRINLPVTALWGATAGRLV